MSEISITSSVNLKETIKNESLFYLEEIKDVFVDVKKAPGNKCGRCWQIYSELKNNGEICQRCKQAITELNLSNSKN